MDSTPSVGDGVGVSSGPVDPSPSVDPPVDTRTRIVEAALDVFVEKGYGGTRVQDIAERANLTAGALYVHFPNRSRLLAEAVMREGVRLVGELIDELGEIRPGDLRVPAVMADQAARETSVFDRLLLEAFALAARDEVAREQFAEAMVGLEDAVRAKVAEVVASGVADPALDVEAVAAHYVMWMMGLLVHRGIGRPRPDREAFLDVCAHVVHGLGQPL